MYEQSPRAVMPLEGRLPVVAIVGPTATGKSEFAEELASRISGEIVSADSMQVYRGMDIGTAKMPIGRRRARYHCLDLVDPGEQFSAALYQAHARRAVEDIRNRGNVPIFCGGTGLYLRAALDDLSFPAGDQTDNPVREKYHRLAEEHGALWLHEELRQVDPNSAVLIEPNNVRRVIRAFEMLAEGTSYAQQHAHAEHIAPYYDTVYLGLMMDTDALYERIDRRVDLMLEEGLLDEVRLLLSQGFEAGITSSQAIGYKEFVPLIKSGRIHDPEALQQAVDDVKRATRRYAKRQRTWFRRDKRIVWLPFEGVLGQSHYEKALELIRYYKANGD